MLLKIILLFFIFYSSVLFVYSGSTDGVLLRNPIGARPLAAGEIFVSIADDINALQYNPAGLVDLSDTEISMMYSNGLLDACYFFCGVVFPIGSFYALGGGVTVLDAGDIEINYVDNSSEILKAQQDYLLNISGAVKLIRNFSIGASMKKYYSILAEQYNSELLVFDCSGLYKVGLETGILNIGMNIKIPTEENIGVSYTFKNKEKKMTIGSNFVHFRENNSMKIHFGFESWFNPVFALRAGYKVGYDLDSLSVGIGFKNKRFKIDYGIAMMGVFGYTHQISVTKTL